MAHAHATADLQLQGVLSWGVLRPAGIPHLRQDICEPHRTVVIHDADAPDGRDGTVEQQLAVVEIDVATEVAFQQLHESECGRNDHLKNVIGRVTDELTR